MIITVDKRSGNVYSASLYIKSKTNNYQSYHVIIWFEPIALITSSGRKAVVDLKIYKASCECNAFVFRKRCLHINIAKNELLEYLNTVSING